MFNDILLNISRNDHLSSYFNDLTNLMKNKSYSIRSESLDEGIAGKVVIDQGVFTIEVTNRVLPTVITTKSDETYNTLEKILEGGGEISKNNKKWMKEIEATRKIEANLSQHTIVHETKHLIQASKGQMLLNQFGAWIYTYDVFDEVEAFKTEALAFGTALVNGHVLKANQINEASLNYPPYDTLPRQRISIQSVISELLPLTLTTRSGTRTLSNLEEYKEAIAQDGNFDVNQLFSINKRSTLLDLLEISCSDGIPISAKLNVIRTW